MIESLLTYLPRTTRSHLHHSVDLIASCYNLRGFGVADFHLACSQKFQAGLDSSAHCKQFYSYSGVRTVRIFRCLAESLLGISKFSHSLISFSGLTYPRSSQSGDVSGAVCVIL